jgi:hypothetical protein
MIELWPAQLIQHPLTLVKTCRQEFMGASALLPLMTFG